MNPGLTFTPPPLFSTSGQGTSRDGISESAISTLTIALAGTRTTRQKAQAVANALNGANAATVAEIAAILVANGSAEVIATVLNAESASAVSAISTALGKSNESAKVASVARLPEFERPSECGRAGQGDGNAHRQPGCTEPYGSQ